jgi:hypothetical protein
LAWAGSGRGLGNGQVSGFSFFFYSTSFVLFPVFCFFISNTNLLFDFAGFDLAVHLQYLEFEIS